MTAVPKLAISSHSPRVLVADDSTVAREGIALIVSRDLGYPVCGLATDHRTTSELVEQHHPDVLLIEPFMGNNDGIFLLKELINGGVLKVNGSISSNTFVNSGGTHAGMGTVNGNVTNNGGTVSPGDAPGPGTLTVAGSYTQQAFATLMIEIAGESAGQFSVLNVLGTADLNGTLDPVLLNSFIPTIGYSFTFLNYASVSGSLSIHDPNIEGAVAHWVVDYGDRGATLTVAQGNVSVPDHGPTSCC